MNAVVHFHLITAVKIHYVYNCISVLEESEIVLDSLEQACEELQVLEVCEFSYYLINALC